MPTLTARGLTLRDCLLRLSQPAIEPPPLRVYRRRGGCSARRLPVRPVFEVLEDYTLLSASIVGTVENDTGGKGVLSPGAPGVPGETVFLDLSHDYQDQTVTTVAATSTTIGPATGGLGGIAGYYMSSLQVKGLQPSITDLKVTMDLTNNSTDPVTVAVISPVGLSVPDLPNLFQIQPGEHFDGSFALNASTPITEATGLSVSGTFIPEQFFSDPPAHINGTDPNGTWGLVFIGSAGDISQLDLKSWSLTITTPDPTTVTDASGNYAFNGLAPGSYQVETLLAPGDVQTFPAGGAAQTVKVADGQTASGVDFGIQPASELATESFYLSAPATSWGQDVTINYTLTNQRNGDAPAFDVAVVLSANGDISPTSSRLQTLHFSGLAAHATTSGSVKVTLPATPPAGFGATSQAVIGFLIDPTHALAHNVTASSASQGLGINEAALSVAPNEAVATGSGVQQNPSIAVDPANPDHIVVAYMDNTLVNTGYAGIGVAVSTDGGSTWQHTSIPLPSGFNQGAATPTVQFDGRGNVFVEFMAATFLGPNKPALTFPNNTQVSDGFESNNGIFVSRSSDGGLTWGLPVAVVSHTFTGTPGTLGTTGPAGTEVPFEIDPDFAVDTYKTLPNGLPNPLYGDLYVAWVRVYPAGQFPGDPNSTDGTDIMFSVSKDGGQTWATQLQTQPAPGEPGNVQVSVIRDPFFGTNDTGAAGQGFVYYPQVSVGPEGDLYVSAYSGGYFTVFHSNDGGASFVAPNELLGLGTPFYALPTATLFDDAFRTLSVRDIVADPSHPGRVYVVEADSYNPLTGQASATPDVVFAYSNDYGQTWETQFQVGNETTNLASLPPGENDAFLSVLNDDDSGRFTLFDTPQQYAQEVVAGQALPSLAVDAQGQVTVIWYDTRRDPLQQNLDVFGTVSNDGGKTFSANFRVSDTTFNPAAGAFTDANGKSDDYLGDRTGLVAVDGVAYAVWTDTRNGSQDIYLQKYSLNQPPAAPLDRLYPDNTPATATGLGQVTARQLEPGLKVSPGNDNWFSLQAGASGELDVVAAATSGNASSLQIQLTDANGHVLPAVVTPVEDSSGVVSGSQLVFPSVAGQTYLVHVSGGTATIGYSLVLQSLTADLGTTVEGRQSGTVAAGGKALYRLEAAVSGSLALTLTPGAGASGDLVLNVLSADGQTVLASGVPGATPAGVPQTLSLPVSQGQVVLIQVTGQGATAQGGFTLTYTNLDQYETPGSTSLFLPTAGDPASVRVADLAGNSLPDILVSSVDTSDALQVLAGNVDGTFQAPRAYDVGPGLSGILTAGYRQLGVADLNGDGSLDVVVPNFRAGDVSVLLGNGGGGFQPQRTFDSVPSPDSLVTGDFVSGSKNPDVAVLENFPQGNGTSLLAVLIGRGDGTFKPALTYPTAFGNGAGPMVVGDFTGNGIDDIIVFSKNEAKGEIFLGNGNGTFQPGIVFSTGENTFAAEAVDLDGNGRLDLITTGTNGGAVYIQMGNGDGTFGPPVPYTVMPPTAGNDVGVFGLAVVGFDSTVSGSTPLPGAPGVIGTPGLYATAQARSGSGPGEVFFLPAEFDSQGSFSGFGTPQVLATLDSAGKIAAFDVNGHTELVATDTGGVRLIEGVSQSQAGGSSGSSLTVPSNTTLGTARDLGSVAHLVTDPQAIVSGHEDAYFTYHVPTEDVAGSGAEVVDFSALFQDVGGAGLGMEVLNAAGDVLGSGDRFRVVAAQGSVLTVHVFGEPAAAGAAAGTGVYTLDIDVLPQVVSVQALSPIPGGPVTSIVLTFQGDRLDPASAQDPANYQVTFLGPGTEEVVPIAATSGGQPIIYDPGVNVDLTSGLTYPTAVLQTVTLLFAHPLAPGSYEITLAPAIQAAAFNAAEAGELAPGDGLFAGHPVVSLSASLVVNGARLVEPELVKPPVASAAQTSAVVASPFLTQLEGDLAAILDQGLRAAAGDSAITAAVNNEILARYAPLYSATQTPPSFAIIWLDPVSIDLQSPQGVNLSYNLSTNALSNGLGSSFVSVGGNVEMIVLENAAGTFNLDVANVPSTARGGEVELTAGGFSSEELTSQLQGGETSFQLALEGGPSGDGSSSGSSGDSPGAPSSTAGGASGGVFASFGALTLTSVILGPVTTGGGTSAFFSTAESSAATVAGPQGGAATAVTQPLLRSNVQRLQGESTEEKAGEDESQPGLASIQTILQVMKQVLSQASNVMGALGRKPPSAVLRQVRELLEKLRRPASPAAANDTGARIHEVTYAFPGPGRTAPSRISGAAPESTRDAGGIDLVVWDHGIDGLDQGSVLVSSGHKGSASGGLWAAAFLASVLVRSEFSERPAPGSPSERRPRAEPRE
jgi:hypothetical protein